MIKKSKNKSTRHLIPHEMPPEGTILEGKYLGKPYKAKIIMSITSPPARVVSLYNREYKFMSAAARAITGHATNGWRFWHIKS
jgi:hypothetical protein